MTNVNSLSFALPPSLGAKNMRTLARDFASVLYEAGFCTVIPMPSYEALEQGLLDGSVDVAWGPPMICAKVEAAGGEILLGAVRGGSMFYRSALICRANDDLKINQIGQPGLHKRRAVWVDQESMGGYWLPRIFLQSKGIDFSTAFKNEKFLGSYYNCFQALLDCKADITASYANVRGLGYVAALGKDAHHLRAIAYTQNCPNDAIVVSPKAVDHSKKILQALQQLLQIPRYHSLLCQTLNLDNLEPTLPKAYAGLLKHIA